MLVTGVTAKMSLIMSIEHQSHLGDESLGLGSRVNVIAQVIFFLEHSDSRAELERLITKVWREIATQ